MEDSLAIALAAGALFVTTFTSAGLLALWVCTWRVHWFLRSLVVLAVVSPPLWIPAYEPFVTLVIEAAVIAAGVFAWRRWHALRQGPHEDGSAVPSAIPRFSLLSILLITTLAAAAVAVGVRVPEQGAQGWLTLVLLGVTAGAATLLAAWLCYGRQRLRIRILATVLLAPLLAIPLVWCEATVGILELTMTYFPFPPLWLAVVPATTGLVLCGCLLAKLAGRQGCPADPTGSGVRVRRISRCMPVVLFTSLMVMLPATICWKLMHPLPIPHVTLPEPNGYHDVVAAGKMMMDSPLLNMAVDPTSTTQLAAEIAKYSEAYELCRLGLSRRSWNPRYFKPDVSLNDQMTVTIDDLFAFRTMARALSREWRCAKEESQFADAARIALDTIHVGQVVARGGLVSEYLTAIAVQGIGHADLHAVIGQLDAEQSRQSIAELEAIERDRETLESLFYRNQVWFGNASGWYGHLPLILADLAGSDLVLEQGPIREYISPRYQAVARLLTVELALHAFRQERGTYPEHLDELVPGLLPQVPEDPFAAAGEPLTYRQTESGYLLYSLGHDLDDDGGRSRASDDAGYPDWMWDGDLRLDSYYAPEEPAQKETGSDNEEASERGDNN